MNRQKIVVRLLRRLPSRTNRLSRPPALTVLAQSTPWNITVAVCLIAASIVLSYLVDGRQLSCPTASTINPMAVIGGLFLLFLASQLASMIFRNHSLVRLTHNVKIFSTGMFAFTLVRLGLCI